MPRECTEDLSSACSRYRRHNYIELHLQSLASYNVIDSKCPSSVCKIYAYMMQSRPSVSNLTSPADNSNCNCNCKYKNKGRSENIVLSTRKSNTSPVCPQQVCKVLSHPQNGYIRKILVQSTSHHPVRKIDTASRQH